MNHSETTVNIFTQKNPLKPSARPTSTHIPPPHLPHHPALAEVEGLKKGTDESCVANHWQEPAGLDSVL